MPRAMRLLSTVMIFAVPAEVRGNREMKANVVIGATIVWQTFKSHHQLPVCLIIGEAKHEIPSFKPLSLDVGRTVMRSLQYTFGMAVLQLFGNTLTPREDMIMHMFSTDGLAFQLRGYERIA
ncbi:hypothetical protein PAXRUDRAFT_17732 [Paxillus rubicundulus Ve08.2h10]|uniref:Secreted protein n=1 Tax=Paxillus rubicundulus Ve08.2h10 TaxID=930991 RepID=A0A0D0D9G4_9AGAM|nr:hypothetical protein PAXRUDRAFT_17732 [Paxillus rubicundulus Ve08.2h10]